MEKVEDEVSTTKFEELLYSGQFILGPFFIEQFTSWKRISINSSIHLTVHPHLNSFQSVYQDKSLTLLGFILDPDNPQASDSEIINILIHQLANCDDFLKETYKFGGRWILIVNDGKEIRLFNDATGLRQNFYTDTRYTKDIWCASQPGIIAETLKLEMDPKAIEFINSCEFSNKKEPNWPFESSPYREIKHMLPNHWVNLETGICERYWPDKALPELSLKEAVKKISADLQGLMKAASNRFDLVLAITSGWDSRVVLASSKDIINKIYSFETVQQNGMPDSHPDLTIPSALLSKFGLKHDIIKSSCNLNGDFIKIFKKSVTLAHDVWAPDAQAILDYYSRNKVAVVGSVSEHGRCHYFNSLRKHREKKLTSHELAMLYYGGKNQYVIDFNQKWLLGLKEIYNFDIPELFLWEQGHGNWLAVCQLEFGMVWKEIFTPFNCRRLIINMLSVDERYRRPPKHKLHKQLILNLWPEVLLEPINPHYKKSLMKKYKILIRSYIGDILPDFLKNIIKKHLGN